MSTFDAGAVEARLTLDRSDFREGMRLAREQARNFESDGIHVNVDVDTKRAEQKLDDVEDEDRTATINADADTLAARTKLAWLTRMRTASIVPMINAAAYSYAQARLRNLGNIVLRLSGTRFVMDRLRDLRDAFADIDKMAVRFANTSNIIANLASILTVSIGNLVTLSSSIGQLGGLLIPLPALIMSLATAIGTMAIALTGWENATGPMLEMRKVIDDITPRWNALLQVVRDSAWEGLGGTFREFVDHTFPVLEEGLANNAKALNFFFSSLMSSIQSIPQDTLVGFFNNAAEATRAVTGAVDPLVQSFVTLGGIGTEQLIVLGHWVSDISTRFNNWITAASEDGRLALWMENAKQAFGELGDVLYNMGGIIGGISDAIKAAGGSTLGSLAVYLKEIHDVVDSPVFQTGLTTIFGGMKVAVDALGGSVGNVGNMLAGLAGPISTILAIAGETMAALISGIADALNDPAFGDALVSFFAGFQSAITSILPILPPVATAIGQIAEVLGQFITALGPSIASVFGTLTNVVSALAPVVSGLIAVLAPVLTQVLDMIGPVLIDAINLIAPILMELITALSPLFVQLMPIITTVLGMVMSVISALAPVLSAIMPILTNLVGILASVLAPVIAKIAEVWSALFDALAPVIEILLKAVGDILPILGDLLLTIWDALSPILDVVVMLLVAFSPVLELLANLIATILPPLIQFIAWLIEGIVGLVAPIIEMLVPAIQSIIEWFQRMWAEYLQPIFTELQVYWQMLWEYIVSIWDQYGAPLIEYMQMVWQNMQLVWSAVWDAVSGVIKVVWGYIEMVIKNALTVIKGVISTVTSALKGDWSAVWESIKNTLSTVWDNMTTAVSNAVNTIFDTVSSIKEKVLGVFSNAKNWLIDAGKNIIQGLIDGITNGVEKVKDTLTGLTEKLPDWKGPEAKDKNLLRKPGMWIMQGFIDSLVSKIPDVRQSMQDVTDAVQVFVGGGDSDRPRFDPRDFPPPGGGGGAGGVAVAGGGGVTFAAGAIQVNVPNNMSPSQVGRHVATRIGELLSNGATAPVPPVTENGGTDA